MLGTFFVAKSPSSMQRLLYVTDVDVNGTDFRLQAETHKKQVKNIVVKSSQRRLGLWGLGALCDARRLVHLPSAHFCFLVVRTLCSARCN